jgi:hypothetical protein
VSFCVVIGLEGCQFVFLCVPKQKRAYRDCIDEPTTIGAAKLLNTIREAKEGLALATVNLLAIVLQLMRIEVR